MKDYKTGTQCSVFCALFVPPSFATIHWINAEKYCSNYIFVLDLIEINFVDYSRLAGSLGCFLSERRPWSARKGGGEREREREGCGQKVPRAMGIARLAMRTDQPTCRKHGPAKLQLELQLVRTTRDGITVPHWPSSASTLMETEMIAFSSISTSERLRLQVRHQNIAQTGWGKLLNSHSSQDWLTDWRNYPAVTPSRLQIQFN